MNNIVLNSTMNTSYNFTSGLLPNTTYTIYVVSELSLCPGIPSTKMVTTLAKEKGIPQSKIVDYLLHICTLRKYLNGLFFLLILHV